MATMDALKTFVSIQSKVFQVHSLNFFLSVSFYRQNRHSTDGDRDDLFVGTWRWTAAVISGLR